MTSTTPTTIRGSPYVESRPGVEQERAPNPNLNPNPNPNPNVYVETPPCGVEEECAPVKSVTRMWSVTRTKCAIRHVTTNTRSAVNFERRTLTAPAIMETRTLVF